LFCMFLLLGFLVEETPCEHGENMQTPHRKAREIAHLSTVHSGEDLPPRANSAPCGNQTHDLLAVRRQCKHLSHRAISLSCRPASPFFMLPPQHTQLQLSPADLPLYLVK